jgi:hypothetical protein
MRKSFKRHELRRKTMTEERNPARAMRVAVALNAVLLSMAFAQVQNEAVTFARYLRESAVPRSVIDTFLNDNSWAQFDGELGYILGNYMPRDGVDGSRTLSTSQANGQRTSFLYVNRPCRINTYGDSFTQCHQVSDGETWQEYLAAHLGEPIRNFGMGGYGVYQTYRRMRREETSRSAIRPGSGTAATRRGASPLRSRNRRLPAGERLQSF